jgi:hypothetical protein
MTRGQWQEVAEKFLLHNSLIKAINQKVTSATVDSQKIDDEGWHDTLLMCTINTETTSQRGFAVSTTHFENAKLTLSVVLGATENQVSRVRHLLSEAHEAIGHPLLMLGLTAELLLDLSTEAIEKGRDECVKVTREFRDLWDRTGRPGADIVMRVENIRSGTTRLDEEVRTSKQMLKKAMEFYCPDDNQGSTSPGSLSTPFGGEDNAKFVKAKIRARFQDIFFQLDSLMTKTRVSVQEMSSMSATVMSPSCICRCTHR